MIKVTDNIGRTYTGTVFTIDLVLCEDDNNRPHALLFIEQDKRFLEQDGEFGCASLWIEKLRSVEILNDT